MWECKVVHHVSVYISQALVSFYIELVLCIETYITYCNWYIIKDYDYGFRLRKYTDRIIKCIICRTKL